MTQVKSSSVLGESWAAVGVKGDEIPAKLAPQLGYRSTLPTEEAGIVNLGLGPVVRVTSQEAYVVTDADLLNPDFRRDLGQIAANEGAFPIHEDLLHDTTPAPADIRSIEVHSTSTQAVAINGRLVETISEDTLSTAERQIDPEVIEFVANKPAVRSVEEIEAGIIGRALMDGSEVGAMVQGSDQERLETVAAIVAGARDSIEQRRTRLAEMVVDAQLQTDVRTGNDRLFAHTPGFGLADQQLLVEGEDGNGPVVAVVREYGVVPDYPLLPENFDTQGGSEAQADWDEPAPGL